MISLRGALVVSHCVLNQSVVVHGLERAVGAIPFVDQIPTQISLVQLPCPEFLRLGANRPGMTYAEYAALPDYRAYCQQLLQPTIQELIQLQADGVQLLGVLGIEESPNCDLLKRPGVFMEAFTQLCQQNDLYLPKLAVPVGYPDNAGDFEQQLQQFLK